MKKSAAAKRRERLKKYRKIAEENKRFYVHPTSPPEEINPIQRWGVSKSKEQEQREILITGTGRCGTEFISRLFQNNGYDIPHERVGKDGTSSHWFITDAEWYPVLNFTDGMKAHIGQRKSDFIFKKTIHLLRHPLPTIKSITNIFRSTDYEFLVENNIIPGGIELKGKKRFLRGMVIYFYVNQFITEHFPNARRVQIENIQSELAELCSFLEIPILKILSDKPTNTSKNILGWRISREEVTFTTLKATDFELASKIFFQAKSLGYSI